MDMLRAPMLRRAAQTIETSAIISEIDYYRLNRPLESRMPTSNPEGIDHLQLFTCPLHYSIESLIQQWRWYFAETVTAQATTYLCTTRAKDKRLEIHQYFAPRFIPPLWKEKRVEQLSRQEFQYIAQLKHQQFHARHTDSGTFSQNSSPRNRYWHKVWRFLRLLVNLDLVVPRFCKVDMYHGYYLCTMGTSRFR